MQPMIHAGLFGVHIRRRNYQKIQLNVISTILLQQINSHCKIHINSYFRNFMLYNPLGIKKRIAIKFHQEALQVIAIAACVVVFVLILTIVIVQLKKKQLNTAIATESTEVILPELTTAQSIEVQ
ncbi:Hypothetical_protein [Hexamita inflata]|uniref:Hypothetical_protein n=1 Tax=Hexamita inflata TaxID=28002 RepID=A0ABP1GJG6_9EUKA